MTNIVEQVYEDHLISRIGEMGSLDSMTDDLLVPSDFLQRVKESDDDPMFVTVEVESGMSISKRNWKPEHVRQVVDKVNNGRMAGNLGHPLIDKDAYEREFPKPQVVWVAAKAREAGGKLIGKFKGYVLKSAEAREYLKLGLIDGVSWFGNISMRPLPGGGYDVVSFDPETLDFARKGRSGLSSRVLSLAGEMASEGGQVEAKDIAALSEDELRTHAPLLVREIERKVTEPLNAKVGEQATAITAAEPEIEIANKVRELLGLAEGENPVEKLTNVLTAVEDGAKKEIRDFINSLVSKKVKTTRGQAVLARVLNVGEMASEYEGDLDDDLKKKIETDFDKKIEGDDTTKALVGEMGGWVDPPAENENRSRSQGGSQVGGRSRAGEGRGRENFSSDDGVVRRTDNITVRKVKV